MKVYDRNYAIFSCRGRWGSPQRMDTQERKALDARSSVKGFDGSPLDRGRRNLHGREVAGTRPKAAEIP